MNSNKIVKGFKKGLPVYVLKLNKPEKQEEGEDPEWLDESADIFPKEVTSLPRQKES